MSRRLLPNIAAIVFSAVMATLLVPGCTIHLGRGESGADETPTGPAGGGGSPGEQTDPDMDSSITPEDEAAIAALTEAVGHADPREVALVDLRTQYATYALAGMLEAQGADPATVDPVALQQLLDQYAPGMWEQADQWVQGLDPSTVELATIKPREECVDKWDFGCKRKEYCDFEDGKTYGTCIVTGCGDGRCPTCPDLWDLDGLVVKGWCSYTCVRDKQIIGIKAIVHVKLFGKLPKCLLLETPIPLEE